MEWLNDLNAPQHKMEADYLLLLWCLRKYTLSDNFFFSSSAQSVKQEGTRNTTIINNNDTSLPKAHENTISNIKVVKISLLSYQNLKINELPATLTFYINGERVADPIPRCFTHDF